MMRLHHLEKVLELYEKEVSGLCLVGYSANTWVKDGDKNLSLNIQWVVQLASAEEEE
jgi:hypothetical protein